jgi:hypothetical protein
MADNFIEVDRRELDRSIAAATKGLNVLEEEVEYAIEAAMLEFSNDMLSEARQRAPIRDGFLRQSGAVDGPTRTPDTIRFDIGFNIEYARIQDLGGDIFPDKAKMLFIPLRPGVRPGEPDLEFGEDFVLTRKVTLKGNRYLTGIIPERASSAARIVGTRAAAIIRERKRVEEGGEE